MATKEPRLPQGPGNYERMRPFLDASWGRNVTPGALKGMRAKAEETGEAKDWDEYEAYNDLRKEKD